MQSTESPARQKAARTISVLCALRFVRRARMTRQRNPGVIVIGRDTRSFLFCGRGLCETEYAVVLGFESFGDIGIIHDQQVLIVLLCRVVRKVE